MQQQEVTFSPIKVVAIIATISIGAATCGAALIWFALKDTIQPAAPAGTPTIETHIQDATLKLLQQQITQQNEKNQKELIARFQKDITEIRNQINNLKSQPFENEEINARLNQLEYKTQVFQEVVTKLVREHKNQQAPKPNVPNNIHGNDVEIIN
jgi:hypothetical protein